MELRHLRCFLAVAEELHFARAAERLHIDQSPLSRTIKELEEELGARLFVRTTRSTQLTRAGRLFLEHVQRVFTVLEQARDSVKSAANGFCGQLRIALSDGVTPSRLPALLARSREEDPEVEIRLFEVPLDQQIKGLHSDLYDAGFSMAEDAGDGIIVTPAWEDELMVAVPARHPVLAFKQIPLKEVLRHPLALGDPAVCEGHARQVDRFLRTCGQEPLIAQRGDLRRDDDFSLRRLSIGLGGRGAHCFQPRAGSRGPALGGQADYAHDLSAAPRYGAVRNAGSIYRTSRFY